MSDDSEIIQKLQASLNNIVNVVSKIIDGVKVQLLSEENITQLIDDACENVRELIAEYPNVVGVVTLNKNVKNVTREVDLENIKERLELFQGEIKQAVIDAINAKMYEMVARDYKSIVIGATDEQLKSYNISSIAQQNLVSKLQKEENDASAEFENKCTAIVQKLEILSRKEQNSVNSMRKKYPGEFLEAIKITANKINKNKRQKALNALNKKRANLTRNQYQKNKEEAHVNANARVNRVK
jgi:hypothetical protein